MSENFFFKQQNKSYDGMEELRKKVITRIAAGDKLVDIAKRFDIHIQTVYKIKKRYKELGNFADRTRSGRPRSTRSEAAICDVKESITNNPETSIRKLAREHKMAEASMRRLVKEDLGLKSLVKRRIQQLTDLQRQKRVDRGKAILNFLRRPAVGKVLVFSDEKDFHIDKYSNRRNSRYISESPSTASPSIKYVGSSKFPAKAMMLGYVGSDGTAFPPIWIKGTMDGVMYKKLLVHKILPLLGSTYGKGNYVWTQDGASCHTSKVVQEYLFNRLGSGGFWSKDLWPPNSPNLNPLDFSIWVHVEERACAIHHSNVASLKCAIEKEWAAMSRDYVRDTCSVFRSRVEQVVAAGGGIIEK